jgi:hypothetical protein
MFFDQRALNNTCALIHPFPFFPEEFQGIHGALSSPPELKTINTSVISFIPFFSS